MGEAPKTQKQRLSILWGSEPSKSVFSVVFPRMLSILLFYRGFCRVVGRHSRYPWENQNNSTTLEHLWENQKTEKQRLSILWGSEATNSRNLLIFNLRFSGSMFFCVFLKGFSMMLGLFGVSLIVFWGCMLNTDKIKSRTAAAATRPDLF